MPSKRYGKYLIQVGVDPDQHEAICELARHHRESQASIVRKAIDVYLKLHSLPAAAEQNGRAA